jgi:hypothetical protein
VPLLEPEPAAPVAVLVQVLVPAVVQMPVPVLVQVLVPAAVQVPVPVLLVLVLMPALAPWAAATRVAAAAVRAGPSRTPAGR